MFCRRNGFFLPLMLLLLCSIFLPACSPRDRQIKRGMYYWKTNVTLTADDRQFLERHQCTQLYVRFFDVDLDRTSGKAVPVAPASINLKDTSIAVVPVVFITPAVLYQLDRFSSEALAHNLSGLLQYNCARAGIHPKEIQIDCDWTASTKEIYFNLLQQLKREGFFKDKKLSGTIRLHQVKYMTKNGIPPADKGLLMCYNMGKLRDIKETNSILNVATAEQYLGNLEHYPLPLDVALPVFRWTVLFEDEQYKGILRDIGLEQLQDKAVFQPQAEHTFTVVKDTFWNGFALKKGQWVRYEDSPAKDVQKLATFVAKHMPADSFKVLLYHLDQQNLKKYTPDELEKIFTRF